MHMAQVQERPSESSAGNAGCLSEHKCECVGVCASVLKPGKDRKCVAAWLYVILQLGINWVNACDKVFNLNHLYFLLHYIYQL